MRNTKFQGQTNFVNPGLHLANLGLDADITPRLKTINNVNFLWVLGAGARVECKKNSSCTG